jgi:ATP-dependent RNA circularization protein (DNA/RNA ligase family)
MISKPTKPLGRPAYGSIPHLPGSKRGPGDHGLSAKQAAILTHQPREGDRVYVTCKMDGSCVAVANIDGEIVPLIRAGYRARDSVWRQHRIFDAWAIERSDYFRMILAPGERIVGEWMIQSHGYVYPQSARVYPFMPFDIFRAKKRIPFMSMVQRLQRTVVVGAGICMTTCLDNRPMTVEHAIAALGNIENEDECRHEGAVWRVERDGEVDFLGKYVRHDWTTGKYLSPDTREDVPVWNTLSTFDVGWYSHIL